MKQIHAIVNLLLAVGKDRRPVTEAAENFVRIVRVLSELAKDVRSPSTSPRRVPLASVFPSDSNVTEALILGGMNPADATAASKAFLTPAFFKIALQTVILKLSRLLQLPVSFQLVEEENLSLVCEKPSIFGEKVVKNAFCGDNLRESVVMNDGGEPPTAFCDFGWFGSGNMEYFMQLSDELMDAVRFFRFYTLITQFIFFRQPPHSVSKLKEPSRVRSCNRSLDRPVCCCLQSL